MEAGVVNGKRGCPMTIAMIWAQDKNGVLGNGNEMLWHVPEDFKHFKAATLGHPVIMGRGSWEALGGKLCRAA